MTDHEPATKASETFPFGRPVLQSPPSADEPRPLFVLGAYPGAIHVRLQPRGAYESYRGAAVLPVESEPEPFWNGEDAAERIAHWRTEIEFQMAWGWMRRLPIHGSTGTWLDTRLLPYLRLSREDAWLTYCLDTYRASSAEARVIEERFVPLASRVGLDTPSLSVGATENEIVAEALTSERKAVLREQVRYCEPEMIVTLGNAALRVMRELVDSFVGEFPERRLSLDHYGRACVGKIDGRTIAWYPLAHPDAPRHYQIAHERWMRLMMSSIATAERDERAAAREAMLQRAERAVAKLREIVGDGSIAGDRQEACRIQGLESFANDLTNALTLPPASAAAAIKSIQYKCRQLTYQLEREASQDIESGDESDWGWYQANFDLLTIL